MSLEALCLMKTDDDVRSRLGKLPRRLASLYLEIYQDFFANTYETSQALIIKMHLNGFFVLRNL